LHNISTDVYVREITSHQAYFSGLRATPQVALADSWS